MILSGGAAGAHLATVLPGESVVTTSAINAGLLALKRGAVPGGSGLPPLLARGKKVVGAISTGRRRSNPG